MGYYTGYSLKLSTMQGLTVENQDEIIADLLATNDCANFALDEDGCQQEPCKWYDHDPEMKKFSKKYPDVLFCLHGDGEESGDIWDKYYHDGKSQVCKAQIVVPAFDKNKLK